MGVISATQTAFIGGEWSKSAQGRFDRPDYRTAMNVCFNAIPLETGAWTRRPGTQHAFPTRGGTAAREIPFEFKQTAPYKVEFTDAHVRFRTGPTLVNTNDSVTITTISTANPAVVQTSAAVTWLTGDQAYFTLLGTTSPLLHNRVFALTKIDTTHFSLSDSITSASIDGSTLGWTSTPAAKINRVLDIASPYVGTTWSDLNWVQAERQVILLRYATKPYTLALSSDPTSSAYAAFTLSAVVFKDGPYLDPIPNGALATPSAKVGIINVTISFNAYDATVAYSTGDFVTSSSVNYQSLIDANVGNTPVSSPSQWVAVDASKAIVNTDGSTGFDGRDVGRLIRLFSQPALWAAGTSYSAGNLVTYNNVDYVKIGGTETGIIPGTNTTSWAIATNASLWTWGRITGILSQISQTLSGSVNIGNMANNGGINASFDGLTVQAASACTATISSGTIGTGVQSIAGYVGKNYSGASAQKIGWATVYPSSDFGWFFTTMGSGGSVEHQSFTLNLRGKASAPSGATDGTLLGSVTITANSVNALTITSSDTTTTWNYVWIDMEASARFVAGGGGVGSYEFDSFIAEVQFFNPPGTGTGSGVQIQVVGPALLYTTPVRVWRLGAYSNKTAYPTCGTWHEGRLWLSGAVDNRMDGSLPNDPFNFAPTGPSGAVADSNAISYTLNSPAVNPIYWMHPDEQGIVVGTLKSGWVVRATNQNNILTPTSIQIHPIAGMDGIANIPPAEAGGPLLVVDRYRRKIQEHFSDMYSGKSSGQNISWQARHITRPNIAQVVFQSELSPIAWMRFDDGSFAGLSYKRENPQSSKPADFTSWHRHALGSGRTVAGLCIGPSIDGTLDALSMVTTDGSTYHVEVMTDLTQEGDALSDAWLLDDAIVPSATSSSNVTPSPYGGLTLYGLWQHNGKTVTAYLGGLDCGDYLVANGAITVPYGDGVSAGTAYGQFTAQFVTSGITPSGVTMFTGTMPAVVGFTYNSDGQVVRPVMPVDTGARTGPALAKKRRFHKYSMLLDGTQGLSVGTDFARLKAALFRRNNNALYPANVSFSGVHWDALADDNSFDGMLAWRVSRPYPATVLAVEWFGQTEDT